METDPVMRLSSSACCRRSAICRAPSACCAAAANGFHGSGAGPTMGSSTGAPGWVCRCAWAASARSILVWLALAIAAERASACCAEGAYGSMGMVKAGGRVAHSGTGGGFSGVGGTRAPRNAPRNPGTANPAPSIRRGTIPLWYSSGVCAVKTRLTFSASGEMTGSTFPVREASIILGMMGPRAGPPARSAAVSASRG